MKRLIFAVAAAFLLTFAAPAQKSQELLGTRRSSVYQQGTQIRVFSPDVKEPLRLFVISDTHVFLSDEREDPYRQYSKRMSKAYNTTRHFTTGEKTNPEDSFRKTVDLARKNGADAIVLLGDMVSYPSEAGVEWVKGVLDASGLPWYYTTGNHDWHYEGMEGTEKELRETWTQERLTPLYHGYDHKLYTVEIKGVKLVFLDNGIYEILPEQLHAFKREMKGKEPKILFGHIPFYAPGYNTNTVAHPDWGYDADYNYKVELRPRWPREGANQTTKDMWKAVLKASSRNNLLASFSGHLHKQQSSVVGDWHQFTVAANCQGGYYEVTIEPLP